MTMYAAAVVTLPVVFSSTVGISVLVLDEPGSVRVLVLDGTRGGMPVESVRGQVLSFNKCITPLYTVHMYTAAIIHCPICGILQQRNALWHLSIDGSHRALLCCKKVQCCYNNFTSVVVTI